MTTGMKPPPPRRNYQQMVRVVREDASGSNPSGPAVDASAVPYRLAQAYGTGAPTPTETRERSLDELGINPRTSRKPEATAENNYLSQREATTLYHQLGSEEQRYFDGMSPDTAPTRAAGWPGTKARVYLDSDAQSQGITPTPPARGVHMEHTQEDGTGTHSGNAGKSAPVHVPTPLPPPPQVKKQTRLPIVGQPSLDGTQGSSVDFDLRVHKPATPG